MRNPCRMAVSGLTRLLAGLLCLAAPLPASAAGLPDFTAHYTVYKDDSPVGTRSLSFSRQADRYRFESVLNAQGLAAMFAPNPVREHSEGLIDDRQLLVERYRREDGNRPQRNLQLDVDNHRNLVMSHLPTALTYPFRPVLRDPLNELLGFMQAANGPASMRYSITDDNGPDPYQLERLGAVTIRTPAGEYQAIQYRRTRVGRDDRYTLFWCVPSLRYLPVRIERHKRGKLSVMALDRLEGL